VPPLKLGVEVKLGLVLGVGIMKLLSKKRELAVLVGLFRLLILVKVPTLRLVMEGILGESMGIVKRSIMLRKKRRFHKVGRAVLLWVPWSTSPPTRYTTL